MLRALAWVFTAGYVWGFGSKLGWRHALRLEDYVRANPTRVPRVFYECLGQ